MGQLCFGDIAPNVAKLIFADLSDREARFSSVSLSTIPLIPGETQLEPVQI
jgi:hypothetical protein